jgi:hypothetical protein
LGLELGLGLVLGLVLGSGRLVLYQLGHTALVKKR